MPKKDALKQFHQENIALAADKLFSEKGIDKTTVSDIAKKAEYSKATVYVYFKSKHEILYYNVYKGMIALHTSFQDILSKNKDVETTYYQMCFSIADYCERYPLYFKKMIDTIAFDETSIKETPILKQIYIIGESLNEDVNAIIQRGIKDNLFDSQHPYALTSQIHWGALTGVITLAYNKKDYIQHRLKMTKQQFLQSSFEMLFQSILKK